MFSFYIFRVFIYWTGCDPHPSFIFFTIQKYNHFNQARFVKKSNLILLESSNPREENKKQNKF